MLAGLCLVLLTAGLISTRAGAIEAEGPASSSIRSFPLLPVAGSPTVPRPRQAGFAGADASLDVRNMADWIMASGDSDALPFAIVDKVNARLFVFDGHGALQGTSPVLLGLARGDVEVAGLGDRKLADIRPDERITPAGRFAASIGQNLNNDVLWVDYNAALSVHQVPAGNAGDGRLRRLASESPLDNRASHGCVVVPVGFFDGVVKPSFAATGGVVYILPEVKSIGEVFAGYDGERLAALR